jgi:protein-S-isoprenylcysteine O-methyltransferase Ste14
MSATPDARSRTASHAPDPAATPAHAGVHVPPPFIYAAGVIIGWLLERWYPAPITDGPSVVRDALALVCGALYVALFVAALGMFRRAKTTLIPNRPASALVTHGPYAITRNPMYLSLACLYLALALLINSWWAVGMLVVVLIVIDRAVIAREERYLAAAFPEDYAAYRARVRRWL